MSIRNLNPMQQFHNTVISYKDIETKTPSRRTFINEIDYQNLNETIKNREPLLFLPSYIEEYSFQDVKYSKASYKIILIGILKDGRKAFVMINGIEPYFEIQVPSDALDNFIPNVKATLNKSKDTAPVKISSFYAKQFKYYQDKPNLYYRFYYKKNTDRIKAINLIISDPTYTSKDGEIKYFSTTHDDIEKKSYYRSVCRDFDITFSSWSVLNNYEVSQHEFIKSDVVFKLHINDYKKLETPPEGLPLELLKDKTLSVCWDIETYSPDGSLPDPEIPEHKVFCLSLTFQWVNDNDAFYKVVLCDYPAKPHKEFQTIVCENETNLLRTFADCFERFKPEFIFGFNDSDYDWRWIIRRAAKTSGLLIYMNNKMSSIRSYQQETDADIEKYKWQKRTVKIDAANDMECKSLHLPGYIPVDVRMLFRKLYPTSDQSSLKFFLEENNLGGKEDMPIHKLFQIYSDCIQCYQNETRDHEMRNSETRDHETRNSETRDHEMRNSETRDHEMRNSETRDHEMRNSEMRNNEQKDQFNLKQILAAQMTDINYYCVIDALRCHELLLLRSLILNNRELSNLSYVSLYDSFYKANGMKIRNLTIAIGQKAPFNMRFSNIQKKLGEGSKFKGAFVFPPVKGLNTSKLSIEERIKKAKIIHDEIKAKLEHANTQRVEHTNISEHASEHANTQRVKHTNISDYLSREIIESNLINTPYEKSYYEWLLVDDKTKQKMYDFINRYGILDFEISDLLDMQANTQANTQANQQAEFSDILAHEGFIEFLKEKTSRPIAGLDFSSLYPSIIRCYNFSPEYCVVDKLLAKKLDKEGHKLTRVEFTYENKKRLAWFIWHDNKTRLNTTETPNSNNFKFGIYPYVLDQLFNKRAELKKHEAGYEHKKNELETKYASNPELAKETETEYATICFQRSVAKTKQLAIKVFMNTFYGEAGNRSSPFFILEVARGITLYGEKSIKLAYKTVLEKNCIVYYGDTDSIYLSVSENIFYEIDKKYYTEQMSKLDYWKALVDYSFKEIKIIRDIVNQVFKDDNKTDYLTMAFEEFLFPSGFTAKKKYFGIPHVKNPIFGLKNIFVKGLDIVKRGVSNFLKEICTDLMYECMDLENVFTIIELIKIKINHIYNRSWKIEDFIQSASYKPNKKNVKVLSFVARMKAKGIIIKPGERFSYVIVKKYPYTYDTRGRKKDIKVGDRMELVEEIEKNNDKIDIDYYMDRSVTGQFARFATYHSMFNEELSENDEDELKVVEEKIYKNACKYIKEICSNYYTKYNTFSKTYKNIYKQTITAFKKNVDDNLSFKLLNLNVVFDKFDEKIIDQILKTAESEAKKICKDYGKDYIESELNKIEKEIINRKNKDARDAREDARDSQNKDNKDARDSQSANNLIPMSMQSELQKNLARFITANKDEERKEKRKKEKLELDNIKTEIKKKKLNKINQLQQVYMGKLIIGGEHIRNIKTIKTQIFEKNTALLTYRFKEVINTLYNLYDFYDKKLLDISSIIRSQLKLESYYESSDNTPKDYDLHDLEPVFYKNDDLELKAKTCHDNIEKNEEVNKILKQYKKLYLELLAEYISKARNDSIIEYLNELKQKNNQVVILSNSDKIKIMTDLKAKKTKQTFDFKF